MYRCGGLNLVFFFVHFVHFVRTQIHTFAGARSIEELEFLIHNIGHQPRLKSLILIILSAHIAKLMTTIRGKAAANSINSGRIVIF